MTLKAIIDKLKLRVISAKMDLNVEVTGGYVSDLLSDVVANASAGKLWITLQGHPNIVAVAVLKELSGILLVNDRSPDEETVKRANAEGIPILSSDRPAFEQAGELYALMAQT